MQYFLARQRAVLCGRPGVKRRAEKLNMAARLLPLLLCALQAAMAARLRSGLEPLLGFLASPTDGTYAITLNGSPLFSSAPTSAFFLNRCRLFSL